MPDLESMNMYADVEAQSPGPGMIDAGDLLLALLAPIQFD